MRAPISPLLFATILAPAVTANGDQLFSEVAIESVFSGQGAALPDSVRPERASGAGRVTGAAPLIKLLDQAGFEAKRVDAMVATTKVEYAGALLPAVLRVAVDRDQMDVVMPLAKLGEQEKLDSRQLLDLLAGDRAGDGMYFSYERSKRWIDLRQTISNRGITPGRLKQVLLKMARVAERRRAAWSDAAELEGTTSTAGRQSDSSATAQPPVGAWVASLNASEAFAMRITDKGAFQLAHVKGGTTSTSTGVARRSGDQLTLIGADGARIIGTISAESSAGFRLTLGARSLNFKATR